MPLYDFTCTKCGHTLEDVMLRIAELRDKITLACPRCDGETEHEQIITIPAVEDWGNGGSGRTFEHLGPQGLTFFDKASYKRHLREHGLREWEPRCGMPGCQV